MGQGAMPPCRCRAEPAESLPQGTRCSCFRTLKSKPHGLRYLLPPGNSRRKAIPKPNKQVARLALSCCQSVNAKGETESVKQTDRFAPIWVKGGSPLQVQGGARGILAARDPAQPAMNSKKQAERLALFIAVRQFPP